MTSAERNHTVFAFWLQVSYIQGIPWQPQEQSGIYDASTV